MISDDTVRGKSFPYRFSTTVGNTLTIHNSQTGETMTLDYDELRAKADDETLDPHRHALYAGALDYFRAAHGG